MLVPAQLWKETHHGWCHCGACDSKVKGATGSRREEGQAYSSVTTSQEG